MEAQSNVSVPVVGIFGWRVCMANGTMSNSCKVSVPVVGIFGWRAEKGKAGGQTRMFQSRLSGFLVGELELSFDDQLTIDVSVPVVGIFGWRVYFSPLAGTNLKFQSRLSGFLVGECWI